MFLRKHLDGISGEGSPSLLSDLKFRTDMCMVMRNFRSVIRRAADGNGNAGRCSQVLCLIVRDAFVWGEISLEEHKVKI